MCKPKRTTSENVAQITFQVLCARRKSLKVLVHEWFTERSHKYLCFYNVSQHSLLADKLDPVVL